MSFRAPYRRRTFPVRSRQQAVEAEAADNTAPAGAVWVCGACGKYGKDRYKIGDESCFLHAVLCREDSLVLVNGMVTKAGLFEAAV